MLVSAVGAGTVVSQHSGATKDAFYAIAAATGLALCGWLAFVSGRKRRDLSRIERPAERYDPRSR